MKKKVIIGVCAAVLVLGAIGTTSQKDSKTETKEETTAETKKEEAKKEVKEEKKEENNSPTFADGVYNGSDMEIKITDHKVIPVGEKGNEYGQKPVIAFWYDVTNISNDSLDPNSAWILNFQAIQDNDPNKVNELEVGSMPDEQFLNSQMEKIKIGGTVSNAVSYELDDNETPVTLVCADILGNEYGRQDFTIK